MNTTSVAALVTAVVGLSACAWTFVHGARQSRMTACVLASIILCLSLVFVSIGQGRLAALDAALVIGALGPLATILVAVRGRGLRRMTPDEPAPRPGPRPAPSAAGGPRNARPGAAHSRRRHAR